MESPIILVGAHRSGTTWLGEILARSPEVAYWVEPRHVWVWGHWFRSDDVLTGSDASPLVIRHIRRTFAGYVAKRKRPRFCEKTPSNCLRLGFVRSVFPDARMVMLLRDGRAVVRSTIQKQKEGIDWHRVAARIRESSPLDYLAWLSRVPWLLAKVTSTRLEYWGPRPPGWREWVGRYPPEVVAAKQWAETIGWAFAELERMDSSMYMVVRYENLVQHPKAVLHDLASFTGLRIVQPLLQFAERTADPSRAEKWRSELDSELLGRIRPYMEPMLERLGYRW